MKEFYITTLINLEEDAEGNSNSKILVCKTRSLCYQHIVPDKQHKIDKKWHSLKLLHLLFIHLRQRLLYRLSMIKLVFPQRTLGRIPALTPLPMWECNELIAYTDGVIKYPRGKNYSIPLLRHCIQVRIKFGCLNRLPFKPYSIRYYNQRWNLHRIRIHIIRNLIIKWRFLLIFISIRQPVHELWLINRAPVPFILIRHQLHLSQLLTIRHLLLKALW